MKFDKNRMVCKYYQGNGICKLKIGYQSQKKRESYCDSNYHIYCGTFINFEKDVKDLNEGTGKIQGLLQKILIKEGIIN